MDAIELERGREEAVHEIARCLSRLARTSYLLSPQQRLFLAEELRDLAGEFDKGEGERLRRRLRYGRYRLVTLDGPNRRPLYRLV
jgi:hypothetical protein